MRPLPVLAVVCLPSGLAAFLLSPQVFWEQWHEPKVFIGTDLVWCLWAVTVLAVGITFGKGVVDRRTLGGQAARADEGLPAESLRRIFHTLYRLTLAAYAVWAAVAVQRGVRLHDVVNVLERKGTSVYLLKQKLAAVTGITTVVEVGVAAAIVGSYLVFAHRDLSVRKRMVVLVGIAVLRSFLNDERLALIEMLVPVVLVWATVSSRSGQMSARRRLRLAVIPMCAPLVLVLYFGGSEYFRSYTYYSQTENVGLWQFSLARMEGYYATSYNNGALLSRYYLPEHRVPYFTVEALWRSPGISSALPYRRFAGMDALDAVKGVYTDHGNPEFNNPGGLMCPLVDWGAVGGSVFLLLFGIAIGAAYGAWRRGLGFGLLVYPFFLDGFLDLPRTFYWTAGRCLPAVAGLAWAAWALHRRRTGAPEGSSPVVEARA